MGKARRPRRRAKDAGEFLKALRIQRFGEERGGASKLVREASRYGVEIDKSEYSKWEDDTSPRSSAPREDVVWVLAKIYGRSLDEMFARVYGLGFSVQSGLARGRESTDIIADVPGEESLLVRKLLEQVDLDVLLAVALLPREQQRAIADSVKRRLAGSGEVVMPGPIERRGDIPSSETRTATDEGDFQGTRWRGTDRREADLGPPPGTGERRHNRQAG